MLCFSTVRFGEARDERRVASLSLCYNRVLFLRGAHNISKVCVHQTGVYLNGGARELMLPYGRGSLIDCPQVCK